MDNNQILFLLINWITQLWGDSLFGQPSHTIILIPCGLSFVMLYNCPFCSPIRWPIMHPAAPRWLQNTGCIGVMTMRLWHRAEQCVGARTVALKEDRLSWIQSWWEGSQPWSDQIGWMQRQTSFSIFKEQQQNSSTSPSPAWWSHSAFVSLAVPKDRRFFLVLPL